MSSEFTKLLEIIISASLINNFVFTRFLGLCIFFGVSKKMETAGLVQVSDTIMRKVSPGLYYKLGIYLALISTNCIILAVPLISVGEKYSFIQTLAFALGSGLGFALALIIMASIREKLELADVPAPFKGLPMAFVITGLIALAFTGFSGLITL
jgi:electron transport complex protein RnfA